MKVLAPPSRIMHDEQAVAAWLYERENPGQTEEHYKQIRESKGFSDWRKVMLKCCGHTPTCSFKTACDHRVDRWLPPNWPR
jgi:hypothetical protein